MSKELNKSEDKLLKKVEDLTTLKGRGSTMGDSPGDNND